MSGVKHSAPQPSHGRPAFLYGARHGDAAGLGRGASLRVELAIGPCPPVVVLQALAGGYTFTSPAQRATVPAVNRSWPIRLRLRLLRRGSSRWNRWVRDLTAWLERLVA